MCCLRGHHLIQRLASCLAHSPSDDCYVYMSLQSVGTSGRRNFRSLGFWCNMAVPLPVSATLPEDGLDHVFRWRP